MDLKSPVFRPYSSRRLRIFHFDPGLRRAGFINRSEPLGDDALKPEIANGGKKFVAMTFGVFDVLDAVTRFAKHPLKRVLSLNQRLAPDVVTREKKIKGQSDRFVIGRTTMQGVEITNAVGRQVDNFRVDNQRCTKPSRFLYNARIAFGPVIAVHCKQAHPPVANMDLQLPR